jgi:hypothetical protein
MWSYTAPTKPGWYYVNCGDVVTSDQFECMKFEEGVDGLIDRDGVPIADYNHCYKFKAIDIKKLNKIGNK